MTKVYVFRNDTWVLHHNYPNAKAAANALAKLITTGILAYVGR